MTSLQEIKELILTTRFEVKHLIHPMAKVEEQPHQTLAFPWQTEKTAVFFSRLEAGVSASSSMLGFQDHFGIVLLGFYWG